MYYQHDDPDAWLRYPSPSPPRRAASPERLCNIPPSPIPRDRSFYAGRDTWAARDAARDAEKRLAETQKRLRETEKRLQAVENINMKSKIEKLENEISKLENQNMDLQKIIYDNRYYNNTYNGQNDQLTLPPGWEVSQTHEGKIFYINHNTQETMWEFPTVKTPEISKCPKNHDLIPFDTPNPYYSCDVCDKKMAQGAIMHGCRICEYDICLNCIVSKKSKKKENKKKLRRGDEVQVTRSITVYGKWRRPQQSYVTNPGIFKVTTSIQGNVRIYHPDLDKQVWIKKEDMEHVQPLYADNKKQKETIKIGSEVIITGLITEEGKKINGREGKIIRLAKKPGRFTVQIPGYKENVSIKMQNLRLLASAPAVWKVLTNEQKKHVASLMPENRMKTTKLLHLVQDETGWERSDCEMVVDYLLSSEPQSNEFSDEEKKEESEEEIEMFKMDETVLVNIPSLLPMGTVVTYNGIEEATGTIIKFTIHENGEGQDYIYVVQFDNACYFGLPTIEATRKELTIVQKPLNIEQDWHEGRITSSFLYLGKNFYKVHVKGLPKAASIMFASENIKRKNEERSPKRIKKQDFKIGDKVIVKNSDICGILKFYDVHKREWTIESDLGKLRVIGENLDLASNESQSEFKIEGYEKLIEEMKNEKKNFLEQIEKLDHDLLQSQTLETQANQTLSILQKDMTELQTVNENMKKTIKTLKAQRDLSEEEQNLRLKYDSFGEALKLLSQEAKNLEERKKETQVELDKVDGLQCGLCIAKPRDYVFQPCHHVYACADCGQGLDRCPICRVPLRGSFQMISC